MNRHLNRFVFHSTALSLLACSVSAQAIDPNAVSGNTAPAPVLAASDVPSPTDWKASLLALMSCPDLASKAWIWHQYDHLIMGNTAIRPQDGDAAVVRVPPSANGIGHKGLAMTSDCTPRYVQAHPETGGRQAVAEAWRNITAVGARPLAVTDNMNFGNPQKPEIMGQFAGAIMGMAEACQALDFPVVSGNVSLYNETQGAGILPTPSIGGVGLVDDVTTATTIAFKSAGEDILVIGATTGWLGQSSWLASVCGREDGAPPPVDLAAERRNGEFVGSLIRARRLTAVHDLSEGGIAVSLAEMAVSGNIGAAIGALPAGPAHAMLFGEDQARYLVTCRSADSAGILAQAAAAGVPAQRIGATGGDALRLPGEQPILVAALRDAYESALPAYMAGASPAAFN